MRRRRARPVSGREGPHAQRFRSHARHARCQGLSRWRGQSPHRTLHREPMPGPDPRTRADPAVRREDNTASSERAPAGYRPGILDGHEQSRAPAEAAADLEIPPVVAPPCSTTATRVLHRPLKNGQSIFRSLPASDPDWQCRARSGARAHRGPAVAKLSAHGAIDPAIEPAAAARAVTATVACIDRAAERVAMGEVKTLARRALDQRLDAWTAAAATNSGAAASSGVQARPQGERGRRAPRRRGCHSGMSGKQLAAALARYRINVLERG